MKKLVIVLLLAVVLSVKANADTTTLVKHRLSNIEFVKSIIHDPQDAESVIVTQWEKEIFGNDEVYSGQMAGEAFSFYQIVVSSGEFTSLGVLFEVVTSDYRSFTNGLSAMKLALCSLNLTPEMADDVISPVTNGFEHPEKNKFGFEDYGFNYEVVTSGNFLSFTIYAQ